MPATGDKGRLAEWVYRRELASTGFIRRCWSAARKRLARALNDPVCSLLVHGRPLRLPLSHPLPAYLDLFPFYDRLPGRLATLLRSAVPHIHGIDVGANIGDSLAAFGVRSGDRFLALEPSTVFHALLLENFGTAPEVTVVRAVCGDSVPDALRGWQIHESLGTARVQPTAGAPRVAETTLDTCVHGTPWETQTRLLKIDTDGHDFAVLRGARKLLKTCQPAVLFECAPHGNPAYIEEALHAFQLLCEAGYTHLLLYNNFGHLLGREPLDEPARMRSRLEHQLADSSYFFDLLALPPAILEEFHRSEMTAFAGLPADRFPGNFPAAPGFAGGA